MVAEPLRGLTSCVISLGSVLEGQWDGDPITALASFASVRIIERALHDAEKKVRPSPKHRLRGPSPGCLA